MEILLGLTEYFLVSNAKNMKGNPSGYENRNILWSKASLNIH